MTPDDFAENRTEPPTPRRLKEAREKGQVAVSRDLTAAAVLLAAAGAFHFLGPAFLAGLVAGLHGSLARLQEAPTGAEAWSAAVWGTGTALAGAAVPLILALVAAALAINFLQVGFLFTTEPLRLRGDRLSPATGLRRAFSMRTFVSLGGGLFRGAVILGVLAATLWQERTALLGISSRDLPDALRLLSGAGVGLAARTALALLALGLLDWAYQRWQLRRDLRMSRQDVRDELKRFEGDPAIRDRRRALRRRLAGQRMIPMTARATVVLTDSENLAVALRYRAESGDPPELVAKGAGSVSDRIREAALEHGVPVIERPDLARDLHRHGELGEHVPERLHEAVADVVALALRMKGAIPAA